MDDALKALEFINRLIWVNKIERNIKNLKMTSAVLVRNYLPRALTIFYFAVSLVHFVFNVMSLGN